MSRKADGSKKSAARGPGTREEQIEKLRTLIGPKGEAEAKKLLEMYSRDVIRYAARIDPRRPGLVRNSLGVRELEMYEGLKAEVGIDEAENWKRLTLAAKSARKRRGE